MAFLITIALHAAALLGLLAHKDTENSVKPVAEPLVVSLLPRADPVSVPQKKDVQTPRPKSSKPVDPIPPKEQPQPNAPPTANAISAPPSPIVPAAVSPSAQARTADPVAQPRPLADAAGDAKDSWEGRVLARLERFKRFPAAARSRREQGVATLRFRLNRQGRILSSSIARSSGSAVLDREALATLARAEPLPPIPTDRPSEIELIVPVEFYLNAR